MVFSISQSNLWPFIFGISDGIGKIECPHFPVAKTYKEFMDNLLSLLNEDHDYKTVAVDSLDWLEKLMKAYVCEENGWNDISQPAYGKGFAATLKLWEEYLEILNRLRDEKGMTILQIAHNEIKRFEWHMRLLGQYSRLLPRRFN